MGKRQMLNFPAKMASRLAFPMHLLSRKPSKDLSLTSIMRPFSCVQLLTTATRKRQYLQKCPRRYK